VSKFGHVYQYMLRTTSHLSVWPMKITYSIDLAECKSSTQSLSIERETRVLRPYVSLASSLLTSLPIRVYLRFPILPSSPTNESEVRVRIKDGHICLLQTIVPGPSSRLQPDRLAVVRLYRWV